ncbi:urate hydroxylase PuuD [Rhodalgimonas zhirmunskyi]|uniref:Urate hydroxylase PuuD n=1 Tax=Rhodalgimonas zhirmunskyi TaxID=2964767 RepID=A0AAJ1X5V3_9RHOB|nr:urate hydroxylase PuuD [Rhodoalgimonas zhirmunskyi]MDQ2094881.1 urate hydroxylase PuuD [Rhodoalgimonas zhirmunskyi]
MFEAAIFWDWISFAVRWLHLITAIAWIGSSFYFIALDLGLRKAEDLPVGAHGEEWQVHGGGFYHIRKFLVAPERMPEHLTWFKWESYMTWLSGAAMLAVVYWLGGELYLLDQHKAELALWQGIVISALSLTIGWIVYDFLCKSGLAEKPTLLMLLLFVLLVVMGWGYNQIFTGRAMMLHLGAFTATVMTANVFFIIIPNQKIVVADLKAGRVPDPKYGKIAKLRSTHNNYLTLPVIFLMLSNHYPLAFATKYNWVIAALVFLMGVTIRHFFNSMHARKGKPWWTWGATVALFLAIMWLSSLGNGVEVEEEAALTPALTPAQARFVEAEGFGDVYDIVQGNCAMCHTAEPAYDGVYHAPKGVILTGEGDVARYAREIFLQAGVSSAMPPPNASWMEAGDRALIARWYRAATGAQMALAE